MKSLSIRAKLIISLAGFAVFLSIKDKDIAFLFTVITTLISVIIADLVFSYFKDKKISISESSVVSALINSFFILGI